MANELVPIDWIDHLKDLPTVETKPEWMTTHLFRFPDDPKFDDRCIFCGVLESECGPGPCPAGNADGE